MALVLALLLECVFHLMSTDYISLPLSGHYTDYFHNDVLRDKRSTNVLIFGQPVQGYCIEVYIGTPPQKFSVVVDTGSANFALSGGVESGISLYYDSSKSSSYSSSGPTFEVQYVDGGWTGVMSQDVLKFCDAAANSCTTPGNVNLALITHSRNFFVNETLWQGILGLAFIAIAQPENRKVTPPFDDLVSKGVFQDTFTITLCGRKRQSDIRLNGLLELGKPPTHPTLYTPLVRRWYYELEIVDVRVNNKLLGLNCKEFNNQASFIDSGTTNLILPGKFYSALVSEIRTFAAAAGMDEDLLDAILAREKYLCVKETEDPFIMFPEIIFSLPTNSTHQFDINIPSQQYIRQTMDSIVKQPSGYLCYRFGIERGSTMSILGAVFMERLIIVHDRATNRLGFSEANCTVLDPVFSKTVSQLTERTNSDCQYLQKKRLGAYIATGFILMILLLCVGYYVVLWYRRNVRSPPIPWRLFSGTN